MTLSKQQFLSTSGLLVQTLEFWLEQRWLIPTEINSTAQFSEGDLARARLIRDLQRDLGVNDEGIDVVLHLIDQLHGVRRALELLRASLDDRSKDV